MKYICENGHVFNDPISWKETRPGDGADEEMFGCPECKEGFEEAFDCSFCETTKPISEKSTVLIDSCITCEEEVFTELSEGEAETKTDQSTD